MHTAWPSSLLSTSLAHAHCGLHTISVETITTNNRLRGSAAMSQLLRSELINQPGLC